MSTSVIVHLPDRVYHQAERLSKLTNRDVADVLAETIQLALPPVTMPAEVEQPVAQLSDKDILALTELQLDDDQDQQLSHLLNKQQAGLLTMAERYELLILMQIYQENLLRKAQALHEAVARGLRPPLNKKWTD